MKRSDGQFERRKNDLYRTWDPRAVTALLPHLEPSTRFAEPCAGDGVLAEQLARAGHVWVWAADIEPGSWEVTRRDALNCEIGDATTFVTNPPWTRQILHPLIVHLSDQAPTWLLFDADWAHTKQARPYLNRLRAIVAVGRLKWVEGSSHDGKDNCCWYLFGRPSTAPTVFIGRP